MVKEGAVLLLARLLLLQPEVKTQETAMQVLMNISSDGTQKCLVANLYHLTPFVSFTNAEESHIVMLKNGVIFPLIDLMKSPQSAESVQLAVVRTLVNTIENGWYFFTSAPLPPFS